MEQLGAGLGALGVLLPDELQEARDQLRVLEPVRLNQGSEAPPDVPVIRSKTRPFAAQE